MRYSTTMRAGGAAVVLGAALAGTAQAKFDDPAASHYTPRALHALALQWEAKAHFYGKQSLSYGHTTAPGRVQTPISSSPPECSFGDGECPAAAAPAQGAGGDAAAAPAAPAQAGECAWDEESGSGGC
jgi:hypothetical protein